MVVPPCSRGLVDFQVRLPQSLPFSRLPGPFSSDSGLRKNLVDIDDSIMLQLDMML